MNGCLLFGVLIFGFYSLVQARLRGEAGPFFFPEILRALRERDYLLASLSGLRASEENLREIVRGEVRAGRLRFADIELLKAYYEESARLTGESRRLLFTYITHMGFVFLVPLLFRMGISGKAWFDRGDCGDLFLAAGFALLGFYVLQKEWPESALHQRRKLSDFLKALLGSEGAGIFEEELRILREKAWQEGRDEGEERRAFLRAWHLSRIATFQTRLAWFENALGPLELMASAFYALLLLGRPLLSHFSGLMPP